MESKSYPHIVQAKDIQLHIYKYLMVYMPMDFWNVACIKMNFYYRMDLDVERWTLVHYSG